MYGKKTLGNTAQSGNKGKIKVEFDTSITEAI